MPIGDQVKDDKSGTVFTLKDVGGKLDWVKEPDTAMSWSGAGKAAASGFVHEAVPLTLGIPGDVEQLGRDVYGKIKGDPATGRTPIPEGAEDIIAQAPGYPPPVPGSLETGQVGKLPEEPRKTLLPTSSEIKEIVSQDVMPEYTPKNFLERGIKTSAGFLPAAMAAPEAAGARLLPRTARSTARYAAAPGFASEGVKELPFVKGSAAEDPLSIAAALLSPKAATKLITPLPATASRIADAAVLGRGVGTPAQVAGSGKGMKLEARTADSVLGPGTHEINKEGLARYTGGALERVGITGERAYSSGVRQRLENEINNSFARLTHQHVTPMDAELTRNLNTAVRNYEQSSLLRHSDEPREQLSKITNIFADAHTNSALQGTRRRAGLPPLQPGFIDGRTYQNLRSELGGMAVDAPTPAIARVYREMRDSLDSKMEHAVRHFGPPEDVGQFIATRERYQNKLILDRAAKGQDAAAAEYQLTPKKLGAAAEHILGDAYGMEQHALAQYARSGQRVLTPLKEQAKHESMMHLATILAGGAAGAGAGGEATRHDGPLGYLVGGAAGLIGTPLLAAAMHSRGGRRYLGNQGLPRESQSATGGVRIPYTGVKNRADALLMAEALAKLGDSGRGAEPK